VLDPTASSGNAGRDWSKVVWTVSGSGTHILTDNITDIYQLIRNYSTDTIVTIPSSYLSVGTYTFSLQLTNVLGQTSQAYTSVTVQSSLITPRVIIAGSFPLFFYRWQSITARALGTLPPCANGTIQYTWRIYSGTTCLYSVKSTSKDARVYKLPAYTLDSSSAYTLQVTAKAGSGAAAQYTTTTAPLQIGSSPISAVISSGSLQTVSTSSAVSIDASSSFDPDYPSVPVNFTWSCKVLYPTYGDDCGLSGVESSYASILSLSSGILSANHTYEFAVLVTSQRGAYSSTSTTVIVKGEDIPLVSISGKIADKYNPDAKAIFTGFVDNTLTSRIAYARWASVDFNSTVLAVAASTPLYKTIAATASTSSIYELALQANTLAAGKTYTFQLSATYSTSNRAKVDSYAQVTITMNSPPRNGEISCDPTSGVTYNTTFLLSTYSWLDDVSDYPLMYVLAYYTLDIGASTVVKSLSELAYASTKLGQGLSSKSYVLTVTGNASDFYGCVASVSTSVTVKPPTDTTALFSAASSEITTALSGGDSTAVLQVAGAVVSTLNDVDCTVPRECSSINRYDCSTTPNTCGKCKSGYLGIDGDSNIACRVESSMLAIGQKCVSKYTCITGRCVGGVCTDITKTCPNSCSSQGSCIAYDLSSNVISGCNVTNADCYVRCRCDSGWYGSDCSLTETEYVKYTAMRDTLCSALHQSTDLDNYESSSAVASRASAIAAVLVDPSQISDTALGYCIDALVQMVNDHSELAGDESVASVCAQGFSHVMAMSTGISDGRLANVSKALASLTKGMQSSMAAGESGRTLYLTNIRVGAWLEAAADSESTTFTPPQSDLEKFLGSSSESVKFNRSQSDSSSAVGVSIVQYAKNPRPTNATTKGIGVSLTKYSVSGGGSSRRRMSTAGIQETTEEAGASGRSRPTRRLLSDDSSSSESEGIVVELLNSSPVYYGLSDAYNISTSCRATQYPYNKTVTCSFERRFTFACPAGKGGIYTHTCPWYKESPSCGIWNGDRYAVDSRCTVLNYTAHSTTCYCLTSNSSSTTASTRRALSTSSSSTSTSSGLIQLAGVMISETTLSDRTFRSGDNLEDAPIHYNVVITVTLSLVLFATVAGFISYYRNDIEEGEKIKKKQFKLLRHSGSFVSMQEMFDMLVPVDFSTERWYNRYLSKLITEHDWISFLSPYNLDIEGRYVRWLLAMARLIDFFFVTTILASIFFADDGFCNSRHRESDCLRPRNFGTLRPKCSWEAATKSCTFNEGLSASILSTVVFTTIVTTCAVPLDHLFAYLLSKVPCLFTYYFCLYLCAQRCNTYVQHYQWHA
jgi:hypothetical protein